MRENFDGSDKIFQNIAQGQLIDEGEKEKFLNSGVKIFGKNYEMHRLFISLTSTKKKIRFIHIHGEIGSGKTALAKHIAYYCNQRGYFTNTVQYYDF